MKMKLSLSAALAHRPRLLILDEATAGLDPVVRDEILDEFLGFIQDEDHAILISSHITSDLEKVADYIAYIHQGDDGVQVGPGPLRPQLVAQRQEDGGDQQADGGGYHQGASTSFWPIWISLTTALSSPSSR